MDTTEADESEADSDQRATFFLILLSRRVALLACGMICRGQILEEATLRKSEEDE